MIDSARKFIYEELPIGWYSEMNGLYRATLLAVYQLTLLLGIALLPVALITRQFGVELPIDRAVLSVKEVYEQTGPA